MSVLDPDELVSSNFIVRYSTDGDLAAIFVEGKTQPFAVLPVVGPLDDERRRRLSGKFIALVAEFLNAEGVEPGVRDVVVDEETNRIVVEAKR